MTNTITELPIDTVKELSEIAQDWVNKYEYIGKIVRESYDEPMTTEDKDNQMYDEGEVLFLSHMTGLRAGLNNANVLGWIKKCQDKYIETLAKFESTKLELDGMTCAYWKRKKNQAEVQYARTQVLYQQLDKIAPANWSRSFGSSKDTKKTMTESAHKDMMSYLKG